MGNLFSPSLFILSECNNASKLRLRDTLLRLSDINLNESVMKTFSGLKTSYSYLTPEWNFVNVTLCQYHRFLGMIVPDNLIGIKNSVRLFLWLFEKYHRDIADFLQY